MVILIIWVGCLIMASLANVANNRFSACNIDKRPVVGAMLQCEDRVTVMYIWSDIQERENGIDFFFFFFFNFRQLSSSHHNDLMESRGREWEPVGCDVRVNETKQRWFFRCLRRKTITVKMADCAVGRITRYPESTRFDYFKARRCFLFRKQRCMFMVEKICVSRKRQYTLNGKVWKKNTWINRVVLHFCL